jgi:hypothetical protein
MGIPLGVGFSGCWALGVAGTGGPGGIPERRQRKPFSGSWFGGVEPFPLKGSALFFASFFKEKKEDIKIEFWVFGKGRGLEKLKRR